ncbi:ABC transporter permease [Burkholderia pseudomallei]|uniref:ABC transporter permease n=1 Tax=Burkholderia pseudomallei TaxID=28450 RepID=UPI0005D95F68|nr:ABC transporter permease [Burkholderia pseudomallei]AJX94569.1 binding--dependent transport system inner membrane component family protein [Burkholderia pseudomallei PB08298010]
MSATNSDTSAHFTPVENLQQSTECPAVQRVLRANFRRSQRLMQLTSFALVFPLFLYLLTVFAIPIVKMTEKSVDNSAIVHNLPATLPLLRDWRGGALPDDRTFAALAADLDAAANAQTIGDLSGRLDQEIPGFRGLLSKTVRHLPLDTSARSSREALIAIDSRWSEVNYWSVIKRNDHMLTGSFLLAAVDHRTDPSGTIVPVATDQRVFVSIFGRTFWMAAVVTVLCLLLAYPLAYLLSTISPRNSNLLMICVLLPFWTSLLVRTTAWIVLLQRGGIVNSALQSLGLIDAPIQMIFNRSGVYVAMVHILLPFMILPLYSVMKSISPAYVRAAVSLGCSPVASFWRIYVPQTYGAVGAGTLLVFILSIGYYITPALVGGPDDQMVSYFVAFYTNVTTNWGMATALGSLLLVATLLLYGVYARLAGANRSRAS